MRVVLCLAAVAFLISCGSGSSPTAPTADPSSTAPPGPTFTVFGVVTAGGAPVAGARVAVLEQRYYSAATTDADGRYAVMTSPLQPWGLSPLVAVSKPGYFADIRFTDANYLPIAKDTPLDFALEPLTYITFGETVRGRVGGSTCSHWGYGTGSCTRMAVAVPPSGMLEVTVSAVASDFDIDVVGPDGTFVAYNPNPRGSPLLRVPVTAGSTYQIRLAGGAPREFELTTALR